MNMIINKIINCIVEYHNHMLVYIVGQWQYLNTFCVFENIFDTYDSAYLNPVSEYFSDILKYKVFQSF